MNHSATYSPEDNKLRLYPGYYLSAEELAEVKAAGKYRQEGKTYVVKDGDIIHFQFNVTAAKKK